MKHACKKEKSIVKRAGDSHFAQNSDKSAAKSWQLPALLEHSMPNQLWLVTVSILSRGLTLVEISYVLPEITGWKSEIKH